MKLRRRAWKPLKSSFCYLTYEQKNNDVTIVLEVFSSVIYIEEFPRKSSLLMIIFEESNPSV